MTMLDVTPTSDLEVISIEDLDFEPVCMIGHSEDVTDNPPCDNVAEWAYRCPNCSYIVVMCTEHRQVIDAFIAQLLRRRSTRWAIRMLQKLGSDPLSCIKCGGHVEPPLPFQPLK